MDLSHSVPRTFFSRLVRELHQQVMPPGGRSHQSSVRLSLTVLTILTMREKPYNAREAFIY